MAADLLGGDHMISGRYRYPATCLALALVGCGGGGSGSSGTGGPAPSPTPTTSPAPTPSPTATAFTAAALGPLTGQIFFDVNGNGTFGDYPDDIILYTNRNGKFGKNAPGLPTSIGIGVPPDQPIYRMKAWGKDNFTGQNYYGLTAPVGATVISPLTSLIDEVGDQATVRQALGLNTGAIAIRAQTDLLTFDPAKNLGSSDPLVAQDARRVIAINMRLWSLAQLPDFAVNSANVETGIAIFRILKDLIAERGTLNLNDRDTLAEIIKRGSQYSLFPFDQYRYGADPLLTYFEFLPDSLDNEIIVHRYDMLYRYFVLQEIREGVRMAMPSQVDADGLSSMYAYLSQQPRADVSTDFYAVPDYGEFVGTTMVIKDCILQQAMLPSCNDPTYQGYLFLVKYPLENKLIEVSVNAENIDKIEAKLNADGSITVSRKPGFLGYAFFDYKVINSAGLQATGRYYLRSLSYQ